MTTPTQLPPTGPDERAPWAGQPGRLWGLATGAGLLALVVGVLVEAALPFALVVAACAGGVGVASYVQAVLAVDEPATDPVPPGDGPGDREAGERAGDGRGGTRGQ